MSTITFIVLTGYEYKLLIIKNNNSLTEMEEKTNQSLNCKDYKIGIVYFNHFQFTESKLLESSKQLSTFY